MEFFGLTQYGFSNPIKDMMRDDYKEPLKSPSAIQEVEIPTATKDTRSWAEKIRELDCYIGSVDGYAYGSQDRLQRMRRKNMWKPVGPSDMYKYPGVNSMNFGWWNCDPELTKLTRDENWYKPRAMHSIITSEMSRYINQCLSVDRFFKI